MATPSSSHIISDKSTRLSTKNRASAEKTDLSAKFSNAGYSGNRGAFNLTQVPIRPRLTTSPQIQCCAKDAGNCSCPKCSAARDSAAPIEGNLAQAESLPSEPINETAANESQQKSQKAATESNETSASSEASGENSSGLIANDSDTELSPGQLKKTVFLQRLREEICSSIGPILATVGQTTEGYPYLNYWLDLYQQKELSDDSGTRSLTKKNFWNQTREEPFTTSSVTNSLTKWLMRCKWKFPEVIHFTPGDSILH